MHTFVVAHKGKELHVEAALARMSGNMLVFFSGQAIVAGFAEGQWDYFERIPPREV